MVSGCAVSVVGFCADCEQVDERNAWWTTNKAGLSHSHQHGFGLMNAWRMVNTARVFCHNNVNLFNYYVHVCTATVRQ